MRYFLECSKDKHLRLEFNPTYARKLLSDSEVNTEQEDNERRTNYGFEKLEVLGENIGLLKLSYFAEPTYLEQRIKSVALFFENTDHLIIDLRGNSGGSGAMLQKLVSGFLEPDKSPILKNHV